MVTGKRLALGLLLMLTLAGGAGHSQRQPEVQHVYITCSLADTVHSVLYISGLFNGLSSKKLDYESSFRSMLRENFPGVYGNASCAMYPNELQAEHEGARNMNRISGMYRRITPTGWKP